jgi:hypothetical protein
MAVAHASIMAQGNFTTQRELRGLLKRVPNAYNEFTVLAVALSAIIKKVHETAPHLFHLSMLFAGVSRLVPSRVCSRWKPIVFVLLAMASATVCKLVCAYV